MLTTNWTAGGAPPARSGTRRRAARLVVLLVALVATVPAAAGPAQAATVSLAVRPEIPLEVTVGQQGVAGRIVIENNSIGEGPVTLNQIAYDPACRDASLPCTSPDVGVFTLAPTATGVSGACAGAPFVVLGDPFTGRYRFTPLAGVDLQPPGSANSTCSIDFTFEVSRMPTSATQPPPAGVETIAIATVVGQSGSTGSTRTGTAHITVRNGSAVLPGGRYVPLTPARILDTRDGTGGVAGPVGPGATVNVQITGRGGVPASGVTAVAMNVTVTQPSGTGFLTLSPTGTPRPLAANLNFTPNKTVPNLVVVKVGTGGKVDLFNSAGTTQVIYDVTGYFSDSPTGNDGRFQPLTPARILDTRNGTGGSSVRLGPGASLDLQVAGQGGVPASGAQAVVMSVAVTTTDATSFLTVYPTGGARPLAANLNWVAGDTVSNRVIAKLGTGGKVTLFNNAGNTDIIVDTNGWFTDASVVGTAGAYAALTPARILDTRDGTGGVAGARPAGSTVDVQVTGRGGVPASGVSAVVLNATVVNPAGVGFLTVFPAGTARPLVSDLNYAAGEVRPNLVVVKVGPAGTVSLYTSAGTDVVFDVAGYAG